MKAQNSQNLIESCLPGRPWGKEKPRKTTGPWLQGHAACACVSVCVCVCAHMHAHKCVCPRVVTSNPCEFPASSSPTSITQNPIYNEEQAALPCSCSCQIWFLGLDCLYPCLASRPVKDGHPLISFHSSYSTTC